MKKTGKIILIIIAVVAVLFSLHLARLGGVSREGTPPALVDGQLAPCPPSPNCVISEYPEDTSHYAAPLDVAALDDDVALNLSREVITIMGGKVIRFENTVISAEFTSNLFGFVDDFQLRLDPETRVLHIRSASRVGHGDMNANSKRVNLFKTMFENRIND